MKLSEIRIGNYVKVSKTEIKFTAFDYSINEDLLSPIPLTEEWLLKFGFNSNSWGEFDLNGICLDCENTDKYEWILYLEGESVKPIESKNEYVCRIYPPIELKYVHQLQNLYFALTGEELTTTE